MQATTARNAAIACFGLGAVLLVLHVLGAFKSKYPHWCQPLSFGSWGDYIPPGNWCIDVGANWNLVIQAQSKFDLMSDAPARLRVAGGPAKEIGASGCNGPFPPYSAVTVTPGKEAMVFVKVRYQQENNVPTCWYNIPIPRPR